VNGQRDAEGHLVLGADGEPVQEGNMLLFAPHAAKLLWLVSHEPRDWAVLRRDDAAWLAAIDDWADQYIPLRLHGSAVNLAIRLLNDANINRAVPVGIEGKGSGN
jgi:hypothetical protein